MVKEKKEKCKCKEDNPFVAIPATLGGIFVGVVAIVLLFANAYASILVPIAWAFVVLGVAALFFAYNSSVKKK